MANNPNRLRISELDFDGIKANLKDFLRGQDTFVDYDFEGSGLSVIVDLLAYNTHYNSVLANMQTNERFLDSAVSRSSVVSIAKQYDYYPQSYSSSTALVNITVNSPSGSPSSLILPKNTLFTSVLNGTTYSFITNDNYVITPVSGIYTFSNIPLVEGKLKTYSYVVNTADLNQKFTIPDINIDISSLKVYIKNSITDNTTTRYTESRDISVLTATAATYFVQGTIDNGYEVYFGDGVIGKPVLDGNVVIMEYVVCSGAITNGMSTFKLSGSISGNTNVAIFTTAPSSGGREFEDIDSIRKNAVKSYSTQNRLVTVEDYKTLLPILYPNIRSLSVWGGDENVPPEFGAVYISIEPTNTGVLTAAQKTYIIDNVIKPKKVTSVVPKIIDPKYIYIKISSTIYFDVNASVYNTESLKVLVRNAIAVYNSTELKKFDGVFRYSKLSSAIDAIDASVLSNITSFELYQYISPIYGQEILYRIEFNNPIYHNVFGTPENAVNSSGFKILNDDRIFYLEDDGDSAIRMYSLNNTIKNYHSTVGTIDFTKGIITLLLNISYFIPTEVGDIGIRVYVESQSFDVVPVRNVILKIKDIDIVTDAIADDIAGGSNSSGSNRIFTSSR